MIPCRSSIEMYTGRGIHGIVYQILFATQLLLGNIIFE